MNSILNLILESQKMPQISINQLPVITLNIKIMEKYFFPFIHVNVNMYHTGQIKNRLFSVEEKKKEATLVFSIYLKDF